MSNQPNRNGLMQQDQKATAMVLARINDNDKRLKGYVVLDFSDAQIHRISLDDLKKLKGHVDFLNATYSTTMNALNGTQGSLTTYPAINEAGVITSKGGIIVTHNIIAQDTGIPVGVIVYNATGTRYDLSYKDLKELQRSNHSCNFNMQLDSKGYLYAVPKNGGQFPVVETEKQYEVDFSYRSSAGEQIDPTASAIITGLHENKMPVFRVFSLDRVRQSEFNKSGSEKFAVALMNMKRLTPYYHAVLSSLNRTPTIGLGTMGVTEDTLIYDVEFLATVTIAELTYILIHECHHIADQHSIRGEGKRAKQLWNIACVLYINTVINKDFEIRYGEPEKEVTIQTNTDKNYKAYIKVPFFGCFLETIGETLDFTRDSPETIYDRLMKENPQLSQSGSGSGKQSKNGKQGQQQGGSGSGSGSGSQQADGSGEGEGEESSIKRATSDDIDESQMGNNQTSKKAHMDNLSKEQKQKSISDLLDKLDKVSVVYNGKRLEGTLMTDITTSVPGQGDTESKERLDKSREALQKMATKVKMEELENGGSLQKNAGVGEGLMQRYIEFGLSANIRWQDLVRNMCQENPKKMFTLGNPNVDYMNMGMTLASQRKIGKPTQISKVKFALDVSGSVSQDELAYYLSEVNNIFTKFKVDGELIYWSTAIGDAGMFSSLKDMLKVKPVSTGGTDVRCVFEYLNNEIKVNGKKEPHKPREIKGIFIITDGCFSMNFAEYKQAFGRKTVWLITGNPITFNPPFGRVIGIGKER